MVIWKECIEILVAVGPAILALALSTRRASQMPAWFMQVVGSSFLALLSVGLVLSRSTRVCDASAVACPDTTTPVPRQAGVFSECYACGTHDNFLGSAASVLNSWSFSVQLLAAGVCVLASILMMVRFILWARRILQITRGTSKG